MKLFWINPLHKVKMAVEHEMVFNPMPYSSQMNSSISLGLKSMGMDVWVWRHSIHVDEKPFLKADSKEKQKGFKFYKIGPLLIVKL